MSDGFNDSIEKGSAGIGAPFFISATGGARSGVQSKILYQELYVSIPSPYVGAQMVEK